MVSVVMTKSPVTLLNVSSPTYSLNQLDVWGTITRRPAREVLMSSTWSLFAPAPQPST